MKLGKAILGDKIKSLQSKINDLELEIGRLKNPPIKNGTLVSVRLNRGRCDGIIIRCLPEEEMEKRLFSNNYRYDVFTKHGVVRGALEHLLAVIAEPDKVNIEFSQIL